MLALKLLLVPSFLAAVSLASRRWGPGIGGWLAGLPWVTGPILFILALESSEEFTAQAATASLAAVAPAIVFGAAYSHACLKTPPLAALAVALTAWFAVSTILSMLPVTLAVSLPIALASLLVARRLFPVIPPLGAARAEPRYELPLRMLLAVLLTLFTTGVAEQLGSAWTGLVAMFPVLSTLLAAFSHRAQGPAYAIVILRSLATGLYGLTGFCLAMAALLPRVGITYSFLTAIASAALLQWATRPRRTITGEKSA